jgi:ornithine cyclodeaminase
MQPLLLSEGEIRGLIGPKEALVAVTDAFIALSRAENEPPAVMIIDIPESEGEVHVKGAHLCGDPFYSVKIVSVFDGNPAQGLPAVGGMVLAFDATNGLLGALLLENGFLTDLRTGAAGALAADLLAKKDVEQVGIVGTGAQGRYQLQALLGVRRPARVVAYDVSPQSAAAYAAEMTARHGPPVAAAASAQEAVEGSDIVVCSTPSREPYLRAEWLAPGMHVTAMGSDNPGKQELFPEVLARVDKLVVDSVEQCVTKGELHHAVEAGTLEVDAVYAELSAIAAGLKPGRTSDAEITVADLTGLGAQDTAVASFVLKRALAEGIGARLDVTAG